MKNILKIAFFFVTLLTAMQMEAQPLTNENNYECGSEYLEYIKEVMCDEVVICRSKCHSCEEYYDCDDIEFHETFCYYICPWCNSHMTIIEKRTHSCNYFSSESGSSSGSGNGGGGGGSGHGGGGGSGGGGGGGDTPFTPAHTPPSAPPANPEGYHRCPCMISPTKRTILENMENSPWYNQDNGYPNLTEDLKRQVAFPEITQQGQNGTCGPAFIQKYLAENYPKQYIECVYRLANYGCYEPWGLWLDKDDRNPIGITQEDLDSEVGTALESFNNQGINYTSVDAIMQSAIQTWTNNNDFYKRALNFFGLTNSGYDPRKDTGNGGGMSYYDVHKFITEEVAHDLSAALGMTKEITYDLLDDYFQNANHDDYTLFAGVDIIQNAEERTVNFGNGNQNHIVELTGTDSGKYIFWSYGKNLETSEGNGSIHTLLFIKNTEYAKSEKNVKRTLVCNCNNCSGNGCDQCMSK